MLIQPMKIDLRDLYNKVKQREYRDRGKRCSGSAEVARRAAEEILRSPCIESVEAFEAAESEWLMMRPPHGQGMKEVAPEFMHAIANNNHFVSPPKFNSFETGADPVEGWFYIQGASSRRGHLKFGYCTIDLSKRLMNYRHKHDCQDAKILSAVYVNHPSHLEAAMKYAFEPSRLPRSVYGDNEWYKASLKKALLELNSLLLGSESNYIHPDLEKYKCNPD